MTAAQFIDLALTPVAAGIAGAFGLRMAMRGQDLALPRYAPVLAGALVAAALLVWKLRGGAA